MATLIPLVLITGFLHLSPQNHLIYQDSSQSSSDLHGNQTTRANEWIQQRLEKQAEMKPFTPSKIERGLVSFEKKGFKESLGIRFGDFYTNLGGITTGAGFLAGTFRYFRANLSGTPLDVSATVGYSGKGYGIYGFQFGNIMRKSPELFLRYSGSGGFSLFENTKETEGDFYLYGEVLYRYFPQEDFFGLGNDSREENRSDYRFNGISYDGIAGLRFSPFLGAFVKAGYLQPNLAPGSDNTTPDTHDIFDDTTAPGLDEQPEFSRLSTSLFMDYRDVPGNPGRGGMYTFTYVRYFDLDGGDFSFRRFSLDLRQYLPLFSAQRILAVRVYSSFDDPTGDGQVPFYLMQTLGGSDSIRGFRSFRFRDKNIFFISTEYRWIPHPLLQFVLFYDTGKVFPEMSDFDFNDLKNGYGVGVRLMSNKSTVLRFDVGRSEEATQFYFKLNASF